MKRYKSIDIVRGIAIMGMVFGHILNWWLKSEDLWLYIIMYSTIGPIAASAFLFVSGVSAALAYKKRLILAKESKEFNMKMVRNIFIFRALFLLIIAFIYNTAIAIAINNYTWIWAWFVLQTISFSLLMVWPLLKTSKIFRIIFGSVVLIVNFMILELLLPYKGQANFYGVLYHILFNPLDLHPILPFYVVLIIGTVIGDILFEINLIKDKKQRNIVFKKNFMHPLFLIGVILTIFSILFLFPSFLLYYTFSAIVYSIGIILIIISIIIGIEELEVYKLDKCHNFFNIYSYYSFTIYIGHNPLYFLFYRQLNVFTIWIAIFFTFVFLTLLLKVVYKKLGPKASLKVGITILSFILAIKIEKKKANRKNRKY